MEVQSIILAPTFTNLIVILNIGQSIKNYSFFVPLKLHQICSKLDTGTAVINFTEEDIIRIDIPVLVRSTKLTSCNIYLSLSAALGLDWKTMISDKKTLKVNQFTIKNAALVANSNHPLTYTPLPNTRFESILSVAISNEISLDTLNAIEILFSNAKNNFLNYTSDPLIYHLLTNKKIPVIAVSGHQKCEEFCTIVDLHSKNFVDTKMLCSGCKCTQTCVASNANFCMAINPTYNSYDYKIQNPSIRENVAICLISFFSFINKQTYLTDFFLFPFYFFLALHKLIKRIRKV